MILKLNMLIMYVMNAHVCVTKSMYEGVVLLHEMLNFVFSFLSFSAIFIVYFKDKAACYCCLFHNSITCSHALIHYIKSHYTLHVKCLNLSVMCVTAT